MRTLRWFAIPALAAAFFAFYINTHMLGLTVPLLLCTCVWLWRWEVHPLESFDDELERLLKAGA